MNKIKMTWWATVKKNSRSTKRRNAKKQWRNQSEFERCFNEELDENSKQLLSSDRDSRFDKEYAGILTNSMYYHEMRVVREFKIVDNAIFEIVFRNGWHFSMKGYDGPQCKKEEDEEHFHPDMEVWWRGLLDSSCVISFATTHSDDSSRWSYPQVKDRRKALPPVLDENLLNVVADFF